MSRNYNEYERNNRSYVAKKKPFPILVIFIPAAALFITAAVLSLMTYSSYLYADREYNNLISSYLHPIASNGEPVPLTSSPDTAKPEGCSQYPELRIDFEGLLNNAMFVGCQPLTGPGRNHCMNSSIRQFRLADTGS